MARESQGHNKIVEIFVVQILHRLVLPAQSALHECNSQLFLLHKNSYFLIQFKFNLCEKNCSSNQTDNLFDVINALFDGLVNEIDFSIYVRKTSK